MKLRIGGLIAVSVIGLSACGEQPAEKPVKPSVDVEVQAPADVAIDFKALSKRDLEKFIGTAWDNKNFDLVLEASNFAVETHQSAFAQHKLGSIYFYGRGADQDLDMARMLFESPLLEGDRWTAFRLGQIYSNEDYAGYDLMEAKEQLRIASEKGVADADKLLAKLN